VAQDQKNDFFQGRKQVIMKTILGAETIIPKSENSHTTSSAAV
jgi:hypothetical protein